MNTTESNGILMYIRSVFEIQYIEPFILNNKDYFFYIMGENISKDIFLRQEISKNDNIKYINNKNELMCFLNRIKCIITTRASVNIDDFKLMNILHLFISLNIPVVKLQTMPFENDDEQILADNTFGWWKKNSINNIFIGFPYDAKKNIDGDYILVVDDFDMYCETENDLVDYYQILIKTLETYYKYNLRKLNIIIQVLNCGNTAFESIRNSYDYYISRYAIIKKNESNFLANKSLNEMVSKCSMVITTCFSPVLMFASVYKKKALIYKNIDTGIDKQFDGCFFENEYELNEIILNDIKTLNCKSNILYNNDVFRKFIDELNYPVLSRKILLESVLNSTETNSIDDKYSDKSIINKNIIPSDYEYWKYLANAYKTSNSWKITLPIRTVFDFFKRKKSKIK